jgi:hypothetical protein
MTWIGQLTATLVIQVVGLDIGQRDGQRTVICRDRARIIPGNSSDTAKISYIGDAPFKIVGLPIMQILSLPIRVIAIVKGSTGVIEFVREDQFPRLARFERSMRKCRRRGVGVNKLKWANIGYLARCAVPVRLRLFQQ